MARPTELIMGSQEKAEELVLKNNVRGMVAALKQNDRAGREFCFNQFFQACVKARWCEPLQEFLNSAKDSSQYKAAVQAMLDNKKKSWKNTDAKPIRLPKRVVYRASLARQVVRI